jgi:hypothetical protein
MSLTWQEWEQDLLERERAFKRRPLRPEQLARPWGWWDWTFATFILLVVIGFVIVAVGDFNV